MKAEEFRRQLPLVVRAALPEPWRTFQHQQRFGLVQFWFDEFAYHFEVAPQTSRARIEVGLHFEHREAKRNAALHTAFDHRFLEVRQALGPEIHLEKWDRGWHKLYRVLPHPGYSEGLLAEIGEELARQIVCLQPMLNEMVAEFGWQAGGAEGRRGSVGRSKV